MACFAFPSRPPGRTQTKSAVGEQTNLCAWLMVTEFTIATIRSVAFCAIGTPSSRDLSGLPRRPEETEQCRHVPASCFRRAPAYVFLHQTPLSLCSLFTSLSGVARWQLLANGHLASGRHEGCGATP